ncbi:MAG TPA: hypothetical protein DCS66_24835 [Flavobacteriaceae bacterium]|nr:hypothetical protein [Flavobacteriaceae bacterium]HAT67786.1 hypothetical protein [Flavobacteriaceae bacterium]|tara:strand:+ start:2115 stop:2906 length:792 start_codon:yes stop_codon:yes gene_type:complete
MIKFFRKIRQKLLSENKFSKYFIYAVGEIVLVVIGILIALQINNWNEQRKERAVEVNFLKNLRADLVSEIDNNTLFANYRFQKAKASSDLINGAEPQTMEDLERYTDTYERVFIWNTFVPNNNTYKELLSSGNLSFIKNDSIKNRLLELDKTYVAIASGENHMRREYETYLYDPHVENVMALGFFDIKEPAFGFPKRLTAKDIDPALHKRLIEDAKWQHHNEKFKNGLRLSFMNNGYLAGIHKDLVQYIENLIALIDKEIAKE